MKYRIEKGCKEHLEKVMELWLKLMEEHKKYDPVFFAEVDKNKVNYFNEYVTDTSDRALFLLYADERIAGFVTAGIENGRYYQYNSKKYCVIGDIMIDENARGNGMGKALIEEVKKWSSQLGVDKIELNVFAKNESGCRFFKQIGFQDSFHTMCLSLGSM